MEAKISSVVACRGMHIFDSATRDGTSLYALSGRGLVDPPGGTNGEDAPGDWSAVHFEHRLWTGACLVAGARGESAGQDNRSLCCPMRRSVPGLCRLLQ